MSMFKASVQYNDMMGSVAADRADTEGTANLLRSKELIGDGEFVAGIRMWAGENHGTHNDPVDVTFFIADLNKYPDFASWLKAGGDAFDARPVNLEMQLVDFFGLFKRFAITLSNEGALEGKAIPKGRC